MSIFNELKTALRSATAKHFEVLKARFESYDLYGYSLYTDDDLCSIGPVANTADKIPVSEQDPTYNYYRYGPHEWALFDDYGLFDSANKIIKDIHENSGLTFDARRDGMLQAALQVLSEMEVDGFFGPRTPSRYIVLWLSDSSDPIMSASVKALNDPAVFSAYKIEYAE